MDANVQSEVWSRLIESKPLSDMGLGSIGGRFDIRGTCAPSPMTDKSYRSPFGEVHQLVGAVTIRGATWKSLDFSNSRMEALRFFGCTIDDCVFDRCSCRDWRLWSTTVSDSRFHSADLRQSGLGGIQGGIRNAYRNVDFSEADLRSTAYHAAEFTNCTFKNTRLDGVDFQTSVFTNCHFEGVLREVQFHRRGFRGDAFPPNEMLRVDFSRAKLRWVEFRGLDLESVRFPEDDEHIVLNDYRAALGRLLDTLKCRTDLAGRRLASALEMARKWAGPRQQRGVLNTRDLFEMCGTEEELNRFLDLIEATTGQSVRRYADDQETKGRLPDSGK
jgi:uncharacterized protein YjbI with pentapeptide repeats